MKVALLNQDGKTSLAHVVIYKAVTTQADTVAKFLKYTWTAGDEANWSSVSAIDFVEDFAETLYISLPSGFLIEFPEPANEIQIQDGSMLVYYDDIQVIPAEYM